MMLPGLISVAFYRRRPTGRQVALGTAAVAVFSGLLGYVLPSGSLTREGSVLVAIVSGLALYYAILAYLVWVYQPMKVKGTEQAPDGMPGQGSAPR